MGFSYIRSIHGLLCALQAILLAFALGAACLIWSDEQVYFLFYKNSMPMITIVLAVFTITWLISVFILINQVIENDVLEGLGKVKVLLIHAACGALLIAAGVITTIYYFSRENDPYTARLLYVMITCWICVVTYAIQFAYAFME